MDALRTIPSKETHYHGVCFRSRLEATWGRYFHKRGWTYAYEPEQFCLDQGRLFYTPDFYINELFLYIEIKPIFKNTVTEEHGLILNFYEEALEKCFYLERIVHPCAVDLYIGNPKTPFQFRFKNGQISRVGSWKK